MPKKPWNKFVTLYPQSPAFSAAVTTSPFKGPCFDKTGKKLPTPFGLFQEWLRKTLTGDWTSQKLPDGFTVRIAIPEDAELITQRFPPTSRPRKTLIAPETFSISYHDSDYLTLATELGYLLK